MRTPQFFSERIFSSLFHFFILSLSAWKFSYYFVGCDVSPPGCKSEYQALLHLLETIGLQRPFTTVFLRCEADEMNA